MGSGPGAQFDGEVVGQTDPIKETTSRPDFLKRTVAIAALIASGFATVGWIAFLGWALTGLLITNADALRALGDTPSRHATAKAPSKPRRGTSDQQKRLPGVQRPSPHLQTATDRFEPGKANGHSCCSVSYPKLTRVGHSGNESGTFCEPSNPQFITRMHQP